MPLLVLFALVIAFFAILFALQNTGTIAIQFLIWQFQGSLALFLLFTLAAGVAIGLLVLMPALLKKTLKLSSQRRKFRDLEWDSQQTASAVTTQQQAMAKLRQNNQDLLTACSLVEPTTHLLTWDTLPHLLAHLAAQQQTTPPQLASAGSSPAVPAPLVTSPQSDNRRYESISLFLIEVQVPSSRSEPQDHEGAGQAEPKLLQAIAETLQAQAHSISWLHSDGNTIFGHTVLALNAQAAADYGKFLRDLLTGQPIQLAGDVTRSIQASVGGAIANVATPVDSQSLLQAAETALEHAKQRGRNRVRINTL